jgi:ATPase subunit of ABC transporter with duplicated ATPase domains
VDDLKIVKQLWYAMIEVRDLSHGFLRKSLFHDVSLRFMKNERYGIVGANGSGKSTFLRILAQEIEPDTGEVDIERGALFFRIGQDHSLNDTIPIIDTASPAIARPKHFRRPGSAYCRSRETP